ncbi:MAG: copper transporter [Actinomycetota bacterium]|nr:copper transporter [Actinomycetota bacterium]
MYNLRYHIASLVAVFLAMAIGLLLGTIVVERGTFDRQRDSIVESLQDEFRTLADENDVLRTDNEHLDAFVGDLVPALTGDVLAGKRFLVIASTGRTDGLGAVTQAIGQAGGEVIVATESEAGMALADPAVSQVATPVVGDLTGDDLVSAVSKTLAAEWATPGVDRPLTDALSEAGAIRFDPALREDVFVDGVIAMAAWDGVPDDLALRIAEELSRVGRISIGAEAGTNPTGVAAASAAQGLSAVDNASSAAGRLSVVWLLAGRAKGYFGTGDAADAPWPTMETKTGSPKD